MLSTLTRIGEQLLEGKGIWARLTTEPKLSKGKKHWVCPILFDCVQKEIFILKDEIELYKAGTSSVKLRFVPPSIWGPRGKKCALTVAPKNFSMLEESLFGKEPGDKGSMVKSIEDLPEFTSTPIHEGLTEINTKLSELRSNLEFGAIKEDLSLGSGDEVVLFYSMIRSEQFNDGKPIKLIDLKGFDEFIVAKFGTTDSGVFGIDYINGNESKEVIEANFSGRYNIHKIFQTSSFNYASGFDSFKQSFQGNADSFAALDKASEYVLDNLQTRIAGISHIVIPNFMSKDLDEFDLESTELYLDKTSDLLFRYQSLEAEIEKELPVVNLFWVNYIAFESDGNSFKIINHIKDVNSFYLKLLTQTFNQTGIDFQNYIGGKYLFNLQSVFNIIPVRDGNKSKINPALNLFKDILEQKAFNPELLFNHFVNLTLCHWYGRYSAFKNIRKIDSFDFAIKDAVFKYSALLYTLKKLNLLDMENEPSHQTEKPESSKSDYQKRIEEFFQKMEYSESEKAMFYLGRVLSTVAYAQYKKGHESKPVLNKINFNGMDADAIVRLSLDLREKARQYTIHRETDWDFGRFTDRFTEKDWTLSKEQNVFYLMAGYSFGLTKSDINS